MPFWTVRHPSSFEQTGVSSANRALRRGGFPCITGAIRNRTECFTAPGAGFWLICLGALAVSGCARFDRRDLSPIEAATRLESRSLTNVALRSFIETNCQHRLPAWPAPDWDLDLLTLAAFYYNPSLEVARAQWATARGGEVTAAQRPNPTITATPGYDTTTSVPSPWFPMVTLDVPIETAGKRGHRRAQAAALSEAARLKISSTAWQLRGNLRASLIDLAGATQRRELLGKQVVLQEQILKLLEQQVQAGALAAPEPLPMRITLQKTRLDIAEAERAVADSRARVAAGIGLPLSAVEAATLSFDWLKNLSQAGNLAAPEIRRLALQSRPDILGSLAEYAAAQSALQLEIAKQYPDVRLQPGYQYDQGDNKWSLGLSLELPVLHHNQGAIAEARARRQEAAARFDELQTRVLGELDRASATLAASRKSLDTLRRLGEEQTRRRAAVAAQYKAGATDQLEFLAVELDAAGSELLRLDGVLKVQQAAAALEDAVQRPMDLPAAAFEMNPAGQPAPAGGPDSTASSKR